MRELIQRTRGELKAGHAAGKIEQGDLDNNSELAIIVDDVHAPAQRLKFSGSIMS